MPNKNNNVLYRDLRFEGAVDQETRTVPISFSSETAVRRFNWAREEYYNEILGHEDGNVDLSRLQDMGVCLFNHDRDKVIGAIIEPVLDTAERKCKAKIRFDSDDFAERIYQKVLSGTLKGISVGYGVSLFEDVRPGAKSTCGRFTGPCKIARSWMPYEVSVVSIPADAAVGVGRSLVDDTELAEFRAYKEAQKQQAEQKRAAEAARMANLKRELDIMEMEGV